MDSLEDYVELLYEGKDKVMVGRTKKHNHTPLAKSYQWRVYWGVWRAMSMQYTRGAAIYIYVYMCFFFI